MRAVLLLQNCAFGLKCLQCEAAESREGPKMVHLPQAPDGGRYAQFWSRESGVMQAGSVQVALTSECNQREDLALNLEGSDALPGEPVSLDLSGSAGGESRATASHLIGFRP